MNVILGEHLIKSFMRGRQSFNALDDVSFQIEAGEFLQIIGRSGSGKTTLLNVILGLLRQDEGKITVLNEDLTNLSEAAKDQFRNQHIGYIPQGNQLISNLTVWDNIRLPFYLGKRAQLDFSQIDKLLEELSISHLSETLPGQLSGGEVRRVMIARALMNNPEIIIADEPTADLDTETTKQIMELFALIHQEGKTIIMVTHEIDTLTYGSRQLKMSDGKIETAVFIDPK